MAKSEWYRDRRDGIWTLDLDPDADVLLQIDWPGWFGTPIDVVPQAPVAEGGTVTIANVDATEERLIFRATGSGARVTFRVTWGSPTQTDDLTIRLRAKQT